ARAAVLERPRVAREPGVAEVETALAREGAAGASGAGREDAVEHVDAARDHLEHPLRVADPHEVARLLLRQEAGRRGRRLEHRLTVLPHAQPADRVAVEVERDQRLGRTLTQLEVEAALRDREAELARRARQVALPLGPQRRPPHGLLELRARHAGGRADVEAHRDVGAEPLLHPRRELGREPLGRAVVDRAERDAVVVRLEQRVAEGEDLEAAGVREDRPVPAHERVEAAELGDQLLAGPEMEVVRVAEDDLGADPAQLVGVDRLHRRLRPDRHERRRPHLAVHRAEDAGAREPVPGSDLEDLAHGRSVDTPPGFPGRIPGIDRNTMPGPGHLSETPYFFAARRPFRQERLLSYIRREHRRGRSLAEVIEDDYVRRCGSRQFVWQTLRDTPLLELLEQDVIEAIQQAGAALSDSE